MNVDAGNGHDGLSIDWVKSQLKAISAIKPPQSLKDKLDADIPVADAGERITRGVWPWSRRTRWAGMAAAAVVAVSVFVWLGIPEGRQVHSAFDANSNPKRAYATDHNSLRPSDTNICDINSFR